MPFYYGAKRGGRGVFFFVDVVRPRVGAYFTLVVGEYEWFVGPGREG